MKRWIVAALLIAMPAYAQVDGYHGDGHHDNHDWYRDLQRPDGNGSCCSNEDCRPTRAFINDNDRWVAMIDGQWVLVPEHTILREYSKDGRNHICANRSGTVLCFMRGSPRS